MSVAPHLYKKKKHRRPSISVYSSFVCTCWWGCRLSMQNCTVMSSEARRTMTKHLYDITGN